MRAINSDDSQLPVQSTTSEFLRDKEEHGKWLLNRKTGQYDDIISTV